MTPNSIDIDVGGTFTDCYVHHQGRVVSAKSPTTGFDLWVGFFRALTEAAKALDVQFHALLHQTNVIRYSTTLAMNKLLERKGPKLGLITTKGFEDSVLIGRGAQWDDGLSKRESRNLASVRKPEPLIPRRWIVGVKERIDHAGRILRPLDEEDTRRKIVDLMGWGVRGIVVSLLWAHRNPVHELRIRELIEEEYPQSCLGSLNVVLAHELQPKKGEYQRTITAVLNSYLHESMARDLLSIRAELREMGYAGPLLMVHNSGGMAELSKTRAIDTFNGGPIAGIVGSLEIAKLYGFENVITTDMGGTSFDVGVVTEGRPHFFEVRPTIDRWMVNTTMIAGKSIGAGGGSIARINECLGNQLEVGPLSAGAMPGPACYNLGGSEPTVTDADVALGYINPGYFHGGKIKLDRELALKAIEAKVARPLGMTAEQAAFAIRTLVDGNMGNHLFKETVLRGHDPREYILFSFGGAGPTHCCGYASVGQIDRLIAFPFSPVFCAYSGSLMDIRHVYEVSRRLSVLRPGQKDPVLNLDEFNKTVRKLIGEAFANAKAEGLDPGKLVFILELDMKYGGQLHFKRTTSPGLQLVNMQEVETLLTTFGEDYAHSFSPAGVFPEGGVSIENFVLHAIYPLKRLSLPSYPSKSSKVNRQAKKGWRNVYWNNEKEFVKTQIYDSSELCAGNVIEGPAVIEAQYTTLVLPDGATLRIDKHLNAVIDLTN